MVALSCSQLVNSLQNTNKFKWYKSNNFIIVYGCTIMQSIGKLINRFNNSNIDSSLSTFY